ncbi:HEAT repeat domain-containing protein, partial [Streptomyces sp. NPDC049099]|uniref:HEAT repeat domain-containing protein n=1 Tax=Streptomyces sp. NPDC049099 TaxID=3155768 RepID=UPI003445219B
MTATVQDAADWLGDGDTGRILRALATSDEYPAVRQAAVAALSEGWRNDPETRQLLFDLADDRDIRRVHQAQAARHALATAWPGDPQARALLEAHAEHGDDLATADLGTGWPGDPQVGGTLRGLAVRGRTRKVRKAAIAALDAWRGDPEIGGFLRRLATEAKPYDLRLTAVVSLGLGWAGDPDTGALLRDRAANDTDPDVRSHAFWALMEGQYDDFDGAERVALVLAELRCGEAGREVAIHQALHYLRTLDAADVRLEGEALRRELSSLIIRPALDVRVRVVALQTRLALFAGDSRGAEHAGGAGDVSFESLASLCADDWQTMREAALDALVTWWRDDRRTERLIRT